MSFYSLGIPVFHCSYVKLYGMVAGNISIYHALHTSSTWFYLILNSYWINFWLLDTMPWCVTFCIVSYTFPVAPSTESTKNLTPYTSIMGMDVLTVRIFSWSSNPYFIIIIPKHVVASSHGTFSLQNSPFRLASSYLCTQICHLLRACDVALNGEAVATRWNANCPLYWRGPSSDSRCTRTALIAVCVFQSSCFLFAWRKEAITFIRCVVPDTNIIIPDQIICNIIKWICIFHYITKLVFFISFLK